MYNFSILRCFFIILLSISSNAIFALEIGIGTHFGQGRGDPAFAFAWMKSAGMTSFRDEVYWNSVELQPVKYAPDAKAQLSLKTFSEAKENGLNPILILSYGNPIYDGGTQPHSDSGRAAFAGYAEWLSKQLINKVEYFEIWNEWNLGAGTFPEKLNYGNPIDYVKLASITYDAVKKVNPAARVIVGAIGDDLENWQWLRKAIDAGLLKKADGISVHLYNHSMPTAKAGAHEIINRLQSLQKIIRESNNSKPIPIYVTETGWPTDWGWSGVSESVAAEQNARLLLEAHTVEDLAGIWWYELVDGGNNPIDREDRFGLLNTELQNKPAGCRLLSLIPAIRKSKLTHNLINGKVQAMLFKTDMKKSLLAVWAGQGYKDTATDVELKGDFGNVQPFDQPCGDRVNNGLKGATNETIHIEANSFPTLLWVGNDAVLTKIIFK